MDIINGKIIVVEHELEDVRARRIIDGAAERALRELGVIVGLEDRRSTVDIALQHGVIRVDDTSERTEPPTLAPPKINRVPGHGSFA